MLAALWLYVLAVSLGTGRIGGRRGFQWDRRERPLLYWLLIALLALMVVHFAGLAIVGQLW